MLKITHVHMRDPGTGHEHIAQVWVVDASTGKGESWAVERAVSHLQQGGKLFVVEGKQVEVRPRQSETTGRWFIQTVADGYWRNNLLELDRY